MATTLIQSYEVMYSANTFVPRIWLMNGGKFIGQLIFEPDGAPLPADNNKNGVNLYYHVENYPELHRFVEERESRLPAVLGIRHRVREWHPDRTGAGGRG